MFGYCTVSTEYLNCAVYLWLIGKIRAGIRIFTTMASIILPSILSPPAPPFPLSKCQYFISILWVMYFEINIIISNIYTCNGLMGWIGVRKPYKYEEILLLKLKKMFKIGRFLNSGTFEGLEGETAYHIVCGYFSCECIIDHKLCKLIDPDSLLKFAKATSQLTIGLSVDGSNSCYVNILLKLKKKIQLQIFSSDIWRFVSPKPAKMNLRSLDSEVQN